MDLSLIGGVLFLLACLASAATYGYIEISNFTGRGPIHNHAVAQGRDYVAERHLAAPYVVSCMGQDTDDNGYVTCFASAPGAEDLNFECNAYSFVNTNPGCKPLVSIRAR